MAWVGAIAQVFGGAMGAGASAKAGKAQAGAYEFNAEVNDQNAQLARQAADADILNLKRDAYQTIGAQRAGYGASGVSGDSGSALDVLANSTAQAVLDQQRRRYQGALQAQDQENQAAINRHNAKIAKTGGQGIAAAQVLSGVGSAASQLNSSYGSKKQ